MGVKPLCLFTWKGNDPRGLTLMLLFGIWHLHPHPLMSDRVVLIRLTGADCHCWRNCAILIIAASAAPRRSNSVSEWGNAVFRLDLFYFAAQYLSHSLEMAVSIDLLDVLCETGPFKSNM